jgi:hypothetical protein
MPRALTVKAVAHVLVATSDFLIRLEESGILPPALATYSRRLQRRIVNLLARIPKRVNTNKE